MKRDSFLTILIVLVFTGVSLFSCKSNVEKENADNDIDVQALSDSLLKADENMVFYTFPSSQEMFAFIKKDAKLVYRTDLVNPTDNISKYIDTRSKTLALGVYLADLSYMTLFNKTTNAYEYLDVITNLSSDLRINLPFQQEFLLRIRDNLNNEDSLIYISDQYATKIIDYLLENKKDKALANITSASYIEGMYIALNLVDSYSDDNPVIKRIVEQKYSFTNLLRYAKKYYTDENTKTAIDLLDNVHEVFEKFSEVEDTKTKLERIEENKMKLQGGKKLVLTEENYNELKQVILETRNKIVENNF